MPSEYLEKIRIERNIKFAITQFNRELLPKEISTSYLVDWILGFADLNDEPSESAGSYDEPNDGLFSQLIINALEDNILFYFTSLMHIGRVWKVSQLAMKDISVALKTENMYESTSLNRWFYEDLNEVKFDNQELGQALTYLLQSAENNHNEIFNKAKQWWYQWETEVTDLIRLIENLNHDYYTYKNKYDWQRGNTNYYHLVYPLTTFRSTQLVLSLAKEGIQIKSKNNNDQKTHLLSQLIRMPEDQREKIERLLYEYHRGKQTELELLKQERLMPIIQQAERHLLKLFEKSNLFDNYSVLNSIPDDKLKELFEKCKLPNNEIFYYAQKWLESLERDIHYYYLELPFKDKFSDKDKIAYAKMADSIIKRHWVAPNSSINLTNDEIIQQLYEDHWIKPMALSATYNLRQNKQTSWNFNSLHEVIILTTGFLNSVGYNILVPSLSRLKTLWEKASKESYFNSW